MRIQIQPCHSPCEVGRSRCSPSLRFPTKLHPPQLETAPSRPAPQPNSVDSRSQRLLAGLPASLLPTGPAQPAPRHPLPWHPAPVTRPGQKGLLPSLHGLPTSPSAGSSALSSGVPGRLFREISFDPDFLRVRDPSISAGSDLTVSEGTLGLGRNRPCPSMCLLLLRPHSPGSVRCLSNSSSPTHWPPPGRILNALTPPHCPLPSITHVCTYLTPSQPVWHSPFQGLGAEVFPACA